MKTRSGISKRIRLSGKVLSGKPKQKARAQCPPLPFTSAGDCNIDMDTFFEDRSWEDIVDEDAMNVDRVLEGEETLPISHAGGEFVAFLERDMRKERGMRKDYRDRRDRVLKRTQAFQHVLQNLVNSYLGWAEQLQSSIYSDPKNPSSDAAAKGDGYEISVVDIFQSYRWSISLSPGQDIASALVDKGLIPCSPFRPTIAITIRTLELFRTAFLRCPRLAVQNVVKILCDLHKVPYKPHLSKQYTICQDVYFSILDQVDQRVQQNLDRDSPHWRLKHACSACTYTLQDETELRFRLLFTMDGNDSLKRVLRRDPLLDYVENEAGDVQQIRVSNELPDQRQVEGDYYVSRDHVAKFKNAPSLHSQPTGSQQSEAFEHDHDDGNPCSERWKNMSDRHTGKSWSIFDETGIFVALCRHGSVLLLTDMVQSGEGSQYPLAIVDKLLDMFGSNLGGGYDIGCRFKTTLSRSQVGSRAKELSYTSLVGAFHGHAHNRICQLSHLTTYVDGLGLSDLEGAERLFSRSNDLASSIRHSSVFHRQQRIVSFFKHLDATDTYEGLSSFLYNNYVAALKLIATVPDFERQVKQLNLPEDKSFDEQFGQWLEDEKAYLLSLSKEPVQETLELDYYHRLESLYKISRDLDHINNTWHVETGTASTSSTQNAEGTRRRLQTVYFKTLEMVQQLEKELNIRETWIEGDANWVRVAEMANTLQYRRSLDKVAQLVVARIFELGRVNHSGTGYKLRQHIAKALKTRSQAIRQALNRFNDAARKLGRQPLRWDDVVEYAFISEFDILAETREDIRLRPWAQPAARTLMDQHFKIKRAKEEIERLNIEIPRLITFIQDEENFLRSMVVRLKTENPGISYQISLRLRRFELANQGHLHRLQKLRSVVGFTGSLSPGIAQEHIAGKLALLVEHDMGQDVVIAKDLEGELAEAEEEEEEEQREVELGEDLEVVMSVLDEPDVCEKSLPS